MPKDPPGTKRWYAIGITETDKQHPWLGASVDWTNQKMWSPPGDNFMDETLWIGTQNAQRCWIETGDGETTDADTGAIQRAYYWAENFGNGVYSEHPVEGVPYPPEGQFQRYTIFHFPGGPYMILIGGEMVGESNQGGDTLFAHAGLETTSQLSWIRGPVQFKRFLVMDGPRFVPWPNRASSVDLPAWWKWNWPTAQNGMPVGISPRTVPFPPSR